MMLRRVRLMAASILLGILIASCNLAIVPMDSPLDPASPESPESPLAIDFGLTGNVQAPTQESAVYQARYSWDTIAEALDYQLQIATADGVVLHGPWVRTQNSHDVAIGATAPPPGSQAQLRYRALISGADSFSPWQSIPVVIQ